MKKITASLLLASSLVMASDFEITPMIGYNFAEGNIQLDDYATFGVEIQYNALDFFIKPELSFFYSLADYKVPTYIADADVYRIALNGVYEYDKVANIVPFAKAGFGYESMDKRTYTGVTGNTDSAFIDVGFGAKIPLSDMFALKLEALYMLKHNDDRYDNNLAILVGLSFAFGQGSQKEAVAQTTQEPEVVEEKAVQEEVAQESTQAVAVVDGDDDNDGVPNSIDICPETIANQTVNSDGCPASITLEINFKYNSYGIDESSHKIIQDHAEFLNKHTNYSTKIVGHTDSVGSQAFNKKLSQQRANAVRDVLINNGADALKVTAEGRGKLEPIADNSTKEGRAKNRRIEAELIRE